MQSKLTTPSIFPSTEETHETPTDDLNPFLGEREFTIDEELDYALWNLEVAQAHVDELRAKKAAHDAALDAHIEKQYQSHLEIEAGKLAMESDKADAEIAHAIAVKYCEENPNAYIKGERTDPFTMPTPVLVDGEKRLGVVKHRTEKKPARDRIIKRDVACRYLRRFDGETRWVQTGPDTGYPILIDADGERRAIVDAFDAFPKPTPVSSDIPF